MQMRNRSEAICPNLTVEPERYPVAERLDDTVLALEQSARLNDRDGIVRSLQNLIPEYQPPLAERPANGARPGGPPLSTVAPAPSSSTTP